MPKNFNGLNTRAIAAKAREEAAKEEKEALRIQQMDEEFWKENNKNVLRKQKRKEDQLQKRQNNLTKKAENKALLEKEMATIKSQKNTSPKLTRAQIESSNAKNKTPKPSLQPSLTVNTNKISAEEHSARNIIDAIKVLKNSTATIDKHPEKRMKAAYLAYEKSMIDALRQNNPTLRQSQVKEIIFKKWQKSATNPLVNSAKA